MSAARPPSFTKAQRYDVATMFGAIILCQVCEHAIYVSEMRIDHHQAWIDGGAHAIENWRPTCFGCNSRKGAIEHKNNAKAKRIAKKHSGQEQKPTRRLQGRKFAAGSRPWPESRPLPSRPFPKRPEIQK